jgi:hypothetical protein
MHADECSTRAYATTHYRVCCGLLPAPSSIPFHGIFGLILGETEANIQAVNVNDWFRFSKLQTSAKTTRFVGKMSRQTKTSGIPNLGKA